jgi:hypothetical protein
LERNIRDEERLIFYETPPEWAPIPWLAANVREFYASAKAFAGPCRALSPALPERGPSGRPDDPLPCQVQHHPTALAHQRARDMTWVGV